MKVRAYNEKFHKKSNHEVLCVCFVFNVIDKFDNICYLLLKLALFLYIYIFIPLFLVCFRFWGFNFSYFVF